MARFVVPPRPSVFTYSKNRAKSSFILLILSIIVVLYKVSKDFRGCLGVDLSTREGYSVKKTVLYTVFSCKSVATAKPGRMQGNAEAAVPPYNNLRPRQRSAANADGRDCRGAKAGQHDAAVSVPRTLSRGALHRNQRHFWYLWCQKYRY